MNINDLCFKLCEKAGTSGDEKIAAEYTKELLDKFMTAEIDRLGNVVGTMGDGKTHILLDAHLDSIGLVVRGIDEKGFLRNFDWYNFDFYICYSCNICSGRCKFQNFCKRQGVYVSTCSCNQRKHISSSTCYRRFTWCTG